MDNAFRRSTPGFGVRAFRSCSRLNRLSSPRHLSHLLGMEFHSKQRRCRNRHCLRGLQVLARISLPVDSLGCGYSPNVVVLRSKSHAHNPKINWPRTNTCKQTTNNTHTDTQINKLWWCRNIKPSGQTRAGTKHVMRTERTHTHHRTTEQAHIHTWMHEQNTATPKPQNNEAIESHNQCRQI